MENTGSSLPVQDTLSASIQSHILQVSNVLSVRVRLLREEAKGEGFTTHVQIRTATSFSGINLLKKNVPDVVIPSCLKKNPEGRPTFNAQNVDTGRGNRVNLHHRCFKPKFSIKVKNNDENDYLADEGMGFC